MTFMSNSDSAMYCFSLWLRVALRCKSFNCLDRLLRLVTQSQLTQACRY